MNNLSWLLYFGEVLPRYVPLIIMTGGLVLGLALAITVGGSYNYSEWKKLVWPSYKRYFFLWLFLCFLLPLIPSTKTIYMIAASEMAGTLITSPEGKEMIGLIREGLVNELKEANSK